MMGVSMNRQEAAARVMVTPVSTTHSHGAGLAARVSAAVSAITGQCHR